MKYVCHQSQNDSIENIVPCKLKLQLNFGHFCHTNFFLIRKKLFFILDLLTFLWILILLLISFLCKGDLLNALSLKVKEKLKSIRYGRFHWHFNQPFIFNLCEPLHSCSRQLLDMQVPLDLLSLSETMRRWIVLSDLCAHWRCCHQRSSWKVSHPFHVHALQRATGSYWNQCLCT